MKLARQQSRENPVYSIRSAYERIKVALDEAGAQKIPYTEPDVDLSTLLGENAHYLMQILAQFPETVETAAALRQPHRVAGYLQTLAEAILDYSDSTAIMGEGVSDSERVARLALADASHVVMENSLALLG
ncbi:MAG TPA: DALR anticodon-binding domain-containing protein, partial [Armatimonadota bacterium]|nr:DALR anticodon-binding domain-containing protein [Armatimonadota bacterium]